MNPDDLTKLSRKTSDISCWRGKTWWNLQRMSPESEALQLKKRPEKHWRCQIDLHLNSHKYPGGKRSITVVSHLHMVTLWEVKASLCNLNHCKHEIKESGLTSIEPIRKNANIYYLIWLIKQEQKNPHIWGLFGELHRGWASVCTFILSILSLPDTADLFASGLMWEMEEQ